MNASLTTLMESPTEGKRIRAHMDGRPDETICMNSKFTPLENHQEAARLLLSRFLWPGQHSIHTAAAQAVHKDWYSAPLTGGKMVHVYADPRRTL